MQMVKHILWALALLLSGLLSGTYTRAQADDPAERLSQASITASEEQSKKIHRELRHLKRHDWAGEYYYGDGLGVNVSLILAPENGFVYSWHGCLGLYDLNYGSVSVTAGRVNLLFTYPNKQKEFIGIAPELLPVRWGEHHYLIPAERVIDFANAINAGEEPSSLFGGRSGSFLLRQGDEKKGVTGWPKIPQEYFAYLLSEPIKAKISSVEQTLIRQSRRITSVKLDVGSADGLKQGMELHVHSPSNVVDTALVTAVSEHSALAVIEQMELTDPVPSTDWELSTRL